MEILKNVLLSVGLVLLVIVGFVFAVILLVFYTLLASVPFITVFGLGYLIYLAVT